MRIQLTRDFRKIATSYGLFQNLSGDTSEETSDDGETSSETVTPQPPPPHNPPHDDADSYVIKIPRALVDSGHPL